MKWYRKAADQGVAEVQFLLGECYEHGDGVPQDYAEAVKWYRKAADQGDADAQYNLGLCYNQGQGVPQDEAESYVWMSLSAANGKTMASASRDRAARKLSRQALEQAQARARKLHAEIQARIEKK